MASEIRCYTSQKSYSTSIVSIKLRNNCLIVIIIFHFFIFFDWTFNTNLFFVWLFHLDKVIILFSWLYVLFNFGWSHFNTMPELIRERTPFFRPKMNLCIRLWAISPWSCLCAFAKSWSKTFSILIAGHWTSNQIIFQLPWHIFPNRLCNWFSVLIKSLLWRDFLSFPSYFQHSLFGRIRWGSSLFLGFCF